MSLVQVAGVSSADGCRPSVGVLSRLRVTSSGRLSRDASWTTFSDSSPPTRRPSRLPAAVSSSEGYKVGHG